MKIHQLSAEVVNKLPIPFEDNSLGWTVREIVSTRPTLAGKSRRRILELRYGNELIAGGFEMSHTPSVYEEDIPLFINPESRIAALIDVVIIAGGFVHPALSW